MNYSIYEIYKARRKLVEKIELDDQLDYDDDKKDLYLGWKETIEILNLCCRKLKTFFIFEYLN